MKESIQVEETWLKEEQEERIYQVFTFLQKNISEQKKYF